MQVIKPMALGLNTRTTEFGGRFGLSVSACLYLPFADEQHTLWSEPSMWQFLATEMAAPLIDEGVVKTTAEYLVHGAAYPPNGSERGCAVRAQVADLEKTLIVHGDRAWSGRQISVARPFTRMPIDWAHAFGGPQSAHNPVGRGMENVELHGVQAQWLPNIELATDPIHSPDQCPQPAGFGRIEPTWAARARYAGTYDGAWMQEHAPGYPPDLNWKHFNLASPDQWFPQDIPTGARFAFTHMHPSEKVVQGCLPRFAVRLIARFGQHTDEQFKEIPCRFTTVWFFPASKALIMIAQGFIEVQEDDASDVSLLIGGVEHLDQPKSREHYLDVYHKRSDPRLGAVQSLNESDLLPEGLAATDPMMEEASQERALHGFAADNQFRGAQLKVDALRQRLVAMGQDPDMLGVKPLVREKPPTLQELPAYLERLMTGAAQLQLAALKQTTEDLERALKVAEANKIELDQVMHRGPPTVDAHGDMQKIRQLLGPNADPVQLARIEQKMGQAHGAVLMGYWQSAHRQPPASAMSPESSRAHLIALQGLYEKKLPLTAAKLTGAELGAIKLPKIEMSAAQMEAVRAPEADFSGADLRYTVLAHAHLQGACFDDAQLASVNLGKADLSSASLVRANLSGAILSGANCTGARLDDARLTGAQVDEAVLVRTRLRGVWAPELIFIKARFEAVDFTGAMFSGSTFIECEFKDCTMDDAVFDGSSFMQCVFTGASAIGASFVRAIFAQGCSFVGLKAGRAVFAKSSLRGVSMERADLQGADLDQADLSEANLQAARLNAARMRHCLLVRTQLGAAALERTDLSHAVMQNADIRGSLFVASNLYGADLSRVRRDKNTLFQDANIDRTKVRPLRRATAA